MEVVHPIVNVTSERKWEAQREVLQRSRKSDWFPFQRDRLTSPNAQSRLILSKEQVKNHIYLTI